MSKGISEYIFALILVLIVLVVVGYLIYIYYGNAGGTFKYTDCTSKELRYCFDLQSGNSPGSWDTYAPGCTQAGVIPDCTSTTTTTS